MKHFINILLLLLLVMGFKVNAYETINVRNDNFKSIPLELKDWVDWVERDNVDKKCPLINDKKICSVLTQVTIKEKSDSLLLIYKGESFSNNWLVLGKLDNIKNITLNNENVEYIDNGSLYVKVKEGEVVLKIELDKNVINKDGVLIDKNVTIINNETKYGFDYDANKLQVNINNKYDFKANGFSIVVARKLKSDVPLNLVTYIKIISSENQLINLGKIIPDGFYETEIKSNVKIVKENNVFLGYVKKGENFVEINSFSNESNELLKIGGLIKGSNNELWAIEKNNKSTINVMNGVAIDPNQYDLPLDWKMFPIYLMENEVSLKINSIGIGDNKIITEENRRVWYGYDGLLYNSSNIVLKNNGNQYVKFSDSVLVKRIEKNSELVNVKKYDGKDGVSINQGFNDIYIETVESKNKEISLNILEANVNKINSLEVNIPLGYTLWGASEGVKYIDNVWLYNWNLYYLLLTLLLVICAYKLEGWKLSLLFASYVILMPKYILIPFLYMSAVILIKIVNKFIIVNKYTKVSYFYLLAIMVLSMGLFIVNSVRYVINPNLFNINMDLSYELKNVLLMAVGLLFCLFVVWVKDWCKTKGKIFLVIVMGVGVFGLFNMLSYNFITRLDMGDRNKEMAISSSIAITPQVMAEKIYIKKTEVKNSLVGDGLPIWNGRTYQVHLSETKNNIKLYIFNRIQTNMIILMQLILMLIMFKNVFVNYKKIKGIFDETV